MSRRKWKAPGGNVETFLSGVDVYYTIECGAGGKRCGVEWGAGEPRGRETTGALMEMTAGVGLVGERFRASETCLLSIDVFIKASICSDA